jgi:phosphotriesterase-related protein
MGTIATVSGTTTPEMLGKTLMHEHLCVGFPGYETHTNRPGPSEADRIAICKDRIGELQDLGFSSLLDPCPSDLGRDVELMAKVAVETGFQVICATGLYNEHNGATPYWKMQVAFGTGADAMAELFIHELTHGIGDTGIRAGIIKIATGPGAITDYERTVIEAAAKASLETGAPITTHTDQGTMGDEQQRIFTSLGVPANRIIIGHSCGTDDHDYHMDIARNGSYLGFDRFGLELIYPDEKRIQSLQRLLQSGAGDRVVVSHDSVWCMRGEPFPERWSQSSPGLMDPTHFSKKVVPQLLEAGVSAAEVDTLLVDNPKRFFAGEKLPELPI